MWRTFAWVAGITLVIYASIPNPSLLEDVSFSQAVYDQKHQLLRLTISKDDKYRLYQPLHKISPRLIEATLIHEDRYYYWHGAVNPAALIRGAWQTYIAGGRRVGGSTITMQVARLRYRIHSRKLGGKILQILRAIQLERHYSKNEILEAYLNLAPYGYNIEGVPAASLIYFNKPAGKLSLSEILTLSVIPQSPAKRTPKDNDKGEAYTARLFLFQQWLQRHPADKDKKNIFQLSIVASKPNRLPFLAPHFTDAILNKYPTRAVIHTTLDSALQGVLQRQVHQYIERNKRTGIQNMAAMLIDFRTMEVKAMVGSANFFDDKIQGQVNGVLAKRSPGSTLKPFIYALGMDQGLIHPMSMLKDAPSSFGAYNPENFDSDFAGPIKVKDALIRSRNLPAVYVASKLKNPSLYDFLRRAGITRLKSEQHYGLSLVLGGAELTMEELLLLYAMLANEGVLRPLKYIHDEPDSWHRQLLSPEAGFLALDMLRFNPRPEQGFRKEWLRGSLPVHWKTGTSYAYRDAWAIGVFGHYVLAVWIGNFDGAGNAAFIGRNAAGPIFFQIVDAILAQDRSLKPVLSRDRFAIRKVKVCALSGDLPGPFCKHIVDTLFIPGKSPITTCSIHRSVLVDKATGLRSCSALDGATERRVYEFWPSDLLRIFKQAGIPRRLPPPVHPRCSITAQADKGVAPKITSPRYGVEYKLRAHRIKTEKIPLSAVTDADVRVIYWFIDGHYLGKVDRNAPFFWKPKPGTFTVRAVDDHGRADAQIITISVVQ